MPSLRVDLVIGRPSADVRKPARMSIEVANESGVPVDEEALAALARFVLDRIRIHPQAELSLLLGHDRTQDDVAEQARLGDRFVVLRRP